MTEPGLNHLGVQVGSDQRRRFRLEVSRELAPLCLREHLDLTAQEVDPGNGQAERLTFPQAQADTESHGNAVARGDRIKQGKHRRCGQRLKDALACPGKPDRTR